MVRRPVRSSARRRNYNEFVNDEREDSNDQDIPKSKPNRPIAPLRRKKPLSSVLNAYDHMGEQSWITQMPMNHNLALSVSSEASDYESPAHESTASEYGEINEYDEGGPDISDISESTSDEEDMDDDTEDNQGEAPAGKTRRPRGKFVHGKSGINGSLRPISHTEEMFESITDKAIEQGFLAVVSFLEPLALRVSTLCSGSESPMFGIQAVQRFLRSKYNTVFNIEQSFAAEIEPEKAAFIERNSAAKVIFRDIVEFLLHGADNPEPMIATTSYGGKVLVEGKIDLLITGFACDDFSTMNNFRKTIEQKGESGDTFHSTLAYMQRHRPTLVILENVTPAPWTREKLKKSQEKKGEISIDEHLDAIGYYTCLIYVNSLDYYVPHTRHRGYMLAVCKEAVPASWKENGEELLKQAFQNFRKVFEAFKREPSVPAESMLFVSDDPDLEAIGSIVEVKTKETSWENCRVAHDQYRYQNSLGSRRPLTHWSSDGSRRLPENFREPSKGLNERSLDAMEAAHLRNADREIDDRYYSRIIELSQSITRCKDATLNGLIGCCMPSYQLWSTVEGRRLTGLEALKLQAIPTYLGNYLNMSESLLLNLAGNAMTTTVVTPFTLAALIVFHALFDVSGRLPPVEVPPPSPYMGIDSLEQHISSPSEYVPASIDEVTALARRTCKRCYCELQNEVTPTPIQRCRKCQHTTCIKCGREPVHEYEKLNKAFQLQRTDPSEFVKYIRPRLPREIGIISWLGVDPSHSSDFIEDIIPSSLNEADRDLFRHHLTKALQSTVFWRCNRRSWSWEITYDCENALVKGCISDTKMEWLIYANVPDLPLDSTVGKYLRRFPIARMCPTGRDVFVGNWQLWTAQEARYRVTIESAGSLRRSFFAELGLPREKNGMVFDEITITLEPNAKTSPHFPEAMEGTYRALPGCGQAYNSFHMRTSDVGQVRRPLGFFVDVPLRTGAPEDATFVFSRHYERLDHGVYRTSLAEIPGWRAPVFHAVDGAIDGIPVKAYNTPVKETRDLVVHGYWAQLSSSTVAMASSPSTIIYSRQLSRDVSALALSACGNGNTRHAILDCSFRVPFKRPSWVIGNLWQILDRAVEPAFWQEFLWAFGSCAVIPGHTNNDERWHRLPSCTQLCADCAPQLPALLWTLKGKGKKAQLMPHEDPEAAMKLEKTLRARVKPLEIKVKVSGDNNMHFQIGAHLPALAHQAVALLARAISLEDHELPEIEMSWRLVTDDVPRQKAMLLPFIPRDTKVDPEAADPFECLFPEQRRVLQWMLNQERTPQTFVQEEVVEYLIRPAGWRMEGRAAHSVTVAGGILASGVGFGKTVVTLAAISANPAPKTAVHRTPLFPTKATLILVPPHLCEQWRQEIGRFMPQSTIVIVIKRVADLANLTIQAVQEADVVVLNWAVLEHPSYIESLAQFAGMIPPATLNTTRKNTFKNNRVTKSWYRAALGHVKTNTQALRTDPTTFLDLLKSQFLDSAEKATSTVAPVPSKHITGAAYQKQNSDARKRPAASEKKGVVRFDPLWVPLFGFHVPDPAPKKGKLSVESSAPDFQLFQNILIEMFEWHRTVIDECTYVDDYKETVAEALASSIRWILSATPRLASFDDVKSMATLLGVYLGREDYSYAKENPHKAAIIKDMTFSEKMDATSSVSSTAYRLRRHELAGKFIDAFLRRDFAENAHIPINSYIVLAPQTPAELTVYYEAQQRYAAINFVARRAKRNANHRDASGDIESKVDLDGKEMLMMKAASFTYDPTAELRSRTPSEICQDIVRKRQSEFDTALTAIKNEILKGFCLRRMIYDRPDSATKKDKDADRFNQFILRVMQEPNGDPDVDSQLKTVFSKAKKRAHPDTWKKFFFQGPKGRSDHKDLEIYPTRTTNSNGNVSDEVVAALKDATKNLNRHCRELVSLQQGRRTFEKMVQIQDGEVSRCDLCSDEIINNFELLTLCGHLICLHCLTSLDQEDTCPVAGCAAMSRDYQKLAADELLDDSVSAQRGNTLYGTKLDDIADFVDKLDNEKLIIFVHHKEVGARVKSALEARGIKVTTLKKGTDSSGALERFKSEVHKGPAGGKTRSEALILNISDEEAAGSNLTCAHRVIFVEPYYTKGSDAHAIYHDAMTQAIGRARRHGQKNVVDVYNFLTMKTIDVDYFEARHSKTIQALTEPSDRTNLVFQLDCSLGRLEDAAPGTHGPFCSSTVNHVTFDGAEL